MRCQRCEAALPDDARICSRCGAELEIGCPRCGRVLSPTSGYCPKCGHALHRPASPPRIDYGQPAAYTPKHLADKILTSRSALEGARKTVTILFADVAGSTAMFENLDPEAAHEIMDGCFRILMDRVHRYEGTVNQFLGDGLMALFGAPIAHEDHAQRACHAALGMQKALTPYRETMRQRYGIDFRMRIGINSGAVVVGAIGDDLRMDYTATGDTANLAARMEALAEPDSVYVSENTFRLTEGYFRFEHLGRKTVKGKAEPVGSYRVIAASSRRTRFDVNAERGLTPLVGRQRDLAFLMDAFRSAAEGKGRVVVISSGAGMGKSRLLYEFRKAVANEDILFFEGKCLSYSRRVAYHPVIDILKSLFRIGDGQEDEIIRSRVAAGLDTLEIEHAEILPYLLELLGARDSGIDMATTTPESRRERIEDALIRLVIAGARMRPMVIAIEDLHWIDAGSHAVIGELIGRIPAEAVLLLLTCRPEFA